MENKTTVNGGIGFWGILQVAFIVLKLCNVIKWSWWAVLLPTEVGAFFVIIAIVFIIWAAKN